MIINENETSIDITQLYRALNPFVSQSGVVGITAGTVLPLSEAQATRVVDITKTAMTTAYRELNPFVGDNGEVNMPSIGGLGTAGDTSLPDDKKDETKKPSIVPTLVIIGGAVAGAIALMATS